MAFRISCLQSGVPGKIGDIWKSMDFPEGLRTYPSLFLHVWLSLVPWIEGFCDWQIHIGCGFEGDCYR